RDIGAALAQQRVGALRAERLGGDDEAADRYDAPAQPAEARIVAMTRRAIGEQDLLRLHRASVRVHAMRMAAADALDSLHAGADVDLRAALFGRLRETMSEPSDVHLRTALVQETTHETFAR